MSEEEINYWLEVFSEDRFAFKSEDGKVLSFYKTFKTIKELQNNWNELKNYLEKQIIDSKAGGSQQYYFNTIYKYMQELEERNEKRRKENW